MQTARISRSLSNLEARVNHAHPDAAKPRVRNWWLRSSEKCLERLREILPDLDALTWLERTRLLRYCPRVFCHTGDMEVRLLPDPDLDLAEEFEFWYLSSRAGAVWVQGGELEVLGLEAETAFRESYHGRSSGKGLENGGSLIFEEKGNREPA